MRKQKKVTLRLKYDLVWGSVNTLLAELADMQTQT